MNLPPWATHVAVDANGAILVYEGEPVWRNGHYETAEFGRRWDYLDEIPEAVSRLLCVRLPATPEDAPESPVNDA